MTQPHVDGHWILSEDFDAYRHIKAGYYDSNHPLVEEDFDAHIPALMVPELMDYLLKRGFMPSYMPTSRDSDLKIIDQLLKKIPDRVNNNAH